jgi:hypothetical protein
VSAARLILLAVLAAAPAEAATQRAAPPSPYVDKGACPFECCTYRDWTAKAPLILLDKPQGKAKIADVAAGTVVTGLTGEVISTPAVMVAARALDDTPIRKGDRFYVLHYSGEGFWSAWFKGTVYAADLSDYRDDAAPLHDFKADWCVKLRVGGKTGWVLNTGQFDNMDSCG